jgi:hypothetical protein
MKLAPRPLDDHRIAVFADAGRYTNIDGLCHACLPFGDLVVGKL